MTLEELGKVLDDRRKELKWSYVRLAGLADVTLGTVRKVLKGDPSIRLITLVKVCDVLGYRPELRILTDEPEDVEGE